MYCAYFVKRPQFLPETCDNCPKRENLIIGFSKNTEEHMTLICCRHLLITLHLLSAYLNTQTSGVESQRAHKLCTHTATLLPNKQCWVGSLEILQIVASFCATVVERLPSASTLMTRTALLKFWFIVFSVVHHPPVCSPSLDVCECVWESAAKPTDNSSSVSNKQLHPTFNVGLINHMLISCQ